MAEFQPLEGYTAIPNLLIDALGGENGSTYSVVLFIARHTIGRQMKLGDAFYRVKEVCLSYDEFARGRRKQDGSRMPDTSGLKYDDAIERGILNAVAHGFIEIVSTTGQRGVRVYTIADTFWLAAGFKTAIKMLADPRIAESATAWKIIAVGAQNTSSEPENPSSSAREIQAVMSSQPAQEEGGRDCKQRGEQRRENKEETKIQEHEETREGSEGKEPVESTAAAGIVQDIDALGQRLADQHLLQSLLAEQERLKPLRPSQAGWGEAQRRLRRLALEIPRLQAALVPPPPPAPGRAAPATFSGQAEPAEDRRSPLAAPPIRLIRNQAAPANTEPAQDTRRERLMQLQREMAHLKKTPSMQLLARQRIPHLEAEMKQLLIELQESA